MNVTTRPPSVTRSGHPRRSRRNRRRAGAIAGLVVAAAIVALAVLPGGDHAPSGVAPYVRHVPGPVQARTPSVGKDGWWTPVRGEPTGIVADEHGAIAISFEQVKGIDPHDGSSRWTAVVAGVGGRGPVRAAADASIVAVATRAGVAVLDRQSGTPLWTAALAVPDERDPELRDPGTVALAAPPDGAPLVLVSATNDLGTVTIVTAFDAGSGAVRWSTRVDGYVVTAPRIAGAQHEAVVDRHVDGEPGSVVAIHLASGATRWEVAAGSGAAASAVAGDLVVVADGDRHYSARIRGIDAATGTTRWTIAVPASFEPTSEPAADGDDYAVIDHFGGITMLDAGTGAIRWQKQDHNGVVGTHAHLVGDAMVFHDASNVLFVADRATGEVRDAFDANGSVIDTAIAEGRVLMALRLGRPSRIEARPIG